MVKSVWYLDIRQSINTRTTTAGSQQCPWLQRLIITANPRSTTDAWIPSLQMKEVLSSASIHWDCSKDVASLEVSGGLLGLISTLTALLFDRIKVKLPVSLSLQINLLLPPVSKTMERNWKLIELMACRGRCRSCRSSQTKAQDQHSRLKLK